MNAIKRYPEQTGSAGQDKATAYQRLQQDTNETCDKERERLHAQALERFEKLNKELYKIQVDYGLIEFGSDLISGKLPQSMSTLVKEVNKAREFIDQVNQMPCYKVRYWSERMGVEQQQVSPTNALNLFQQFLQAETNYFQEWMRINFMDPIKVNVELPQIMQQSMDELQQQFQAIGAVAGAQYLPTAYQAVKTQVDHLIAEGRQPLQKKAGKMPAEEEFLNLLFNSIEGYLNKLLVVLEQTLVAEGVVEPESASLIPFNRLEYLQEIIRVRISHEAKKEYEGLMKLLEKRPELAQDPAFMQRYHSFSQDLQAVTRANDAELAALGAKYHFDVTQLPPTAGLHLAVSKTIVQRMVDLYAQFEGPKGVALAQTDSKRWLAIKAEYQQLATMRDALSENDLAGLQNAARILGLRPEDYPS